MKENNAYHYHKIYVLTVTLKLQNLNVVSAIAEGLKKIARLKKRKKKTVCVSTAVVTITSVIGT